MNGKGKAGSPAAAARDMSQQVGMVLLIVVVALLGLGVILVFNRLVKGRQLVREGWSGIDVQLKRRADLIPNLVEVVRGYAGHERTCSKS